MMNPWPETRDTLLARLQNPSDREAWEEFVAIYEPLVFRFACRRGLQDADARDTTQRVLWTVARAADRWEPGKVRGRFRGWLARVTTNAVINLVQRDDRHRASGRSSMWDLLEQAPQTDDEACRIWEHERRSQIFRHAASQIRSRFSEDVWHAFWNTSVDGKPIEQVASELNKSVGAVYAARSRVFAQIRNMVTRIEQSESIAEELEPAPAEESAENSQ